MGDRPRGVVDDVRTLEILLNGGLECGAEHIDGGG